MLSLAIGLAGSTAIIISALSTTRSRMLLWSVIALSLFAAQYGILGAHVALMTSSVSLIRNFTFYLSIKRPILGHWSVMLFFVLVIVAGWIWTNDFSNFNPLNLIPLLANLLNSAAVFIKDLRISKAIFLTSGLMWLYYQYSFGAYGLMAGELFTITANIIALTKLIQTHRKKHITSSA